MQETPFEQMLETMGRFNEELIRAGVLVAAEGLDDPSQGVVVDYSGETPVVTDGPYAESAEQLTGFYLVRTDDLEDLLQLAGMLAGEDGPVEVRPTTGEEGS